MRGRRNDLRLSRKVKPKQSASLRVRGLKRSVSRAIRTPKQTVAPVNRTAKKQKKLATRRKIRKTSDTISVTESSSLPTAEAVCSNDFQGRRKRTDASEYIRKRFLYSSWDTNSRSRNIRNSIVRSKPSFVRSSPSTRKLPKIDEEFADNVSLPTKSKRGRRKQSPEDQNSTVQNYTTKEASMGSQRKGYRRTIKTKRVAKNDRSNWHLLETYELNAHMAIENDRPLSGTRSPPVRRSKVPPAPLTELRLQADGHAQQTREYVSVSRCSLQSKKQVDKNYRRCTPRRYKRTDILESHSFNSAAYLSPNSDMHGDSLMNFDPEDDPRSFRHSHNLDLEVEEEEYARSPTSPEMSEEQSQLPNEELDEEDLLAPELSILAGPTTVAGSDGVILSNSHTLLASLPQSVGGSRRKSPVRPMQVIRTKAVAPFPPPAQTSTLGSSSEGSSFLYNQSYGGRLSSDDSCLKGDSGFRQHSLIESSQTVIETPSGLKSASVLRLPSGIGTTSIKIRPIRDRVSSEDADNKSVSGNQQIASRGVANNSPRQSTTATKTLASHTTHNASTVRRRPSILKRSPNTLTGNGASTFSGHPHTGSDLGVEVTHSPNTRTIGAFTPTSTHSHKAASLIQTSPAVSVTGGSAAEAGSAKLLQLVTASSLIAPVGSVPLTASDKLFGRRQPAFGSTFSSMTIAPVSLQQNIDADDNRTNAGVSQSSNAYRYAVLRGCPGGKRYLVLGSPGVFDRTAINPVAVTGGSKNAGSEYTEVKIASTEQPQQPLSDSTAQENGDDRTLCDPHSDGSMESELAQPVDSGLHSTLGADIHMVSSPTVTTIVAN